jgi:hypothetical protein
MAQRQARARIGHAPREGPVQSSWPRPRIGSGIDPRIDRDRPEVQPRPVAQLAGSRRRRGRRRDDRRSRAWTLGVRTSRQPATEAAWQAVRPVPSLAVTRAVRRRGSYGGRSTAVSAALAMPTAISRARPCAPCLGGRHLLDRGPGDLDRSGRGRQRGRRGDRDHRASRVVGPEASRSEAWRSRPSSPAFCWSRAATSSWHEPSPWCRVPPQPQRVLPSGWRGRVGGCAGRGGAPRWWRHARSSWVLSRRRRSLRRCAPAAGEQHDRDGGDRDEERARIAGTLTSPTRLPRPLEVRKIVLPPPAPSVAPSAPSTRFRPWRTGEEMHPQGCISPV